MDLELTGKIAVVTGASKGIGLAVVRALAAEGVLVVAGARTVDTLGGIEGVTPVAVDLVDARGSERLVAEAASRHGRLDVLVNNVGGVTPRSTGSSRSATTTSSARCNSTSSHPCARPAPRSPG